MFCAGAALALPNEFAQQGYVVDVGRSTASMTCVSASMTGPNVASLLFDETHANILFMDGYYNLLIGSIEQLDPDIFVPPELLCHHH